MRIVKAGIAYWALIFALGFILGTVRVLWLAPQVGETLAGFIELPVVLGASWMAARWLVARGGIVSGGAALAMGALAFALLLVAELALAITLFAMGPGEWLASIARPPGLYGLIGQIVFALMPWLVVRRRG